MNATEKYLTIRLSYLSPGIELGEAVGLVLGVFVGPGEGMEVGSDEGMGVG